jgi:hypothetical protein
MARPGFGARHNDGKHFHMNRSSFWSRAGSWAGAMLLAGFDPLEGERLREAVTRYAIVRAAPELLPPEILRGMNAEAVNALRETCDLARGKKPKQ